MRSGSGLRRNRRNELELVTDGAQLQGISSSVKEIGLTVAAEKATS